MQNLNDEIIKAIAYSVKYRCKVFVYSTPRKIIWGDCMWLKDSYKHVATYENGVKIK